LSPPASPLAGWWLQDATYKELFGANIYRSAKAGSADYSTETARRPVATVKFNATNASITASGGTVPAWSFYIELPKHHTMTADGNQTWYFGVEYNNNSGGATGITTNNYYTIDKTGDTITVISVN
jgi:hypothetical protein